MSKSKSLKVFRLPEIKEHISEVFYLLNFFSQPQLEQWGKVPDAFFPSWVDMSHRNADSPILFLTLILSSRIDLNLVEPYIFIFNEKIKLIFYEISGLLDNWILDTPHDFIFLKRQEDEIMDTDRIWLILSRLCKIALSYEEWDKYQINELSFKYFVDKYAHPYDPI